MLLTELGALSGSHLRYDIRSLVTIVSKMVRQFSCTVIDIVWRAGKFVELSSISAMLCKRINATVSNFFPETPQMVIKTCKYIWIANISSRWCLQCSLVVHCHGTRTIYDISSVCADLVDCVERRDENREFRWTLILWHILWNCWNLFVTIKGSYCIEAINFYWFLVIWDLFIVANMC